MTRLVDSPWRAETRGRTRSPGARRTRS